jgi:hypothetical protein
MFVLNPKSSYMRKFILPVVAFVGLCSFPNASIFPASIGSSKFTVGDFCSLYFVFAAMYFIYKRKHIPKYGKIWDIISMFFTVVFARLLGGYISEKWKQKDYASAFFAFTIPLLWFIDKKEKKSTSIK